ncbi:polycystic kidney disease protein 1-like 2 [Sinocyclocheilus anshuiensis]|uniref:polycystic kidney disease protein 1-like 2 n=1 Tax=Sinocyclocheilus anshuiensis TaxID=1608454 RepID=UPI0007B950A6|nr:PREDICTED: polycystic kidney disease protein 1-like 2 [Sinocyclocheilus anshuiensis]
MASSKQVLVCCWISIVLMPLTTCKDESEESGHKEYDYGRRILEIHEGIAYEFVQESMQWAEAQESCEKHGGHLLRDLNFEIKELLQTQYTETGPWWVSRELMYKNSISGFEPVSYYPVKNYGKDVNEDHFACTYMVKDPFQLVTTPNCSMSFSSLCTRDLNTHLTSREANKRSRRSLTDRLSSLTDNIGNTAVFLMNARTMLKDLETTTEELSKGNKVQYLQNIYDHLLKSGELNGDQLDEIMNSTSAILLYSQECEPDNMDDLEELITLAGNIYGKALAVNGNIVKELPTGTIYVTRQDSSTLGEKSVGSKDGGSCQLPTLSAMTSQLPTGNINVQLFQFKENPLELKSNESITGTTCSFSLQNGNSLIKFKNLAENIEIYLPRPEASEPEVVDIAWKPGFTVTSTFNISDVNVTVVVAAIPNQNTTLSFTLHPPEEANATYLNQSTNVTYKDNYRWLITPEMRWGIEGTWKVAVLPAGQSSSKTLTFKVSVFVTKCLFWDTALDAWSREGCMVGPNTMPNLTHCLCNHTTFFGSSFFVMPNQVDLSQTAALFATVNENYIVVVLLSCFFALFLVVVMWAWYADRKAHRKRKMTLLENNHPCAMYNYLVNVQTGHRRGAGTTAKVMVTLQFTEGQSEPYNLSDPEKPVFERGGVDVFLLSMPFCLGELQNIDISHDNSGGSPDWYLDRITMQDLQTQEVTHFLCSTWLRGETCRRTFNSANMNEIASFGNIFQTRTSSGFRDEHIWVSIVDPPRRSPFTRVQRVSCCMSLLLCTMAINIMFWNLPIDEESPVLLKIGSFELTWQEFMVAIESGLFMFPINILIITIFRHIKPRIVPNKDKAGTSKKTTAAAAVSMDTIIKETIGLLNHLSKSPKNMLAAKEIRPETSGDLFWGLNKVNDVLQIMQVDNVGDPHWSYCSRFVFHSLSHISNLLEHVGEKGFFLNEELRQARGTVNVLLKKAEMATLQHASQSPPSVQVEKKKQGWWLPWWFLFIGWFLLFAMSGISTFFTLLYGFQYGRESSIQWVITLTLSLVQSIFILQPLKVIFVAIFFAMILRPVAVENSEEVELLLQEQKKKCEEYAGRSIS